jgi:hypothetical protein
VPAQDAMTELNGVVKALDAGTPPAVASAAFKSMLARLPRGSSLSSQGKTDLRKLFAWVKKKGLQKLQDELFEIRFGIELEDAWYRNKDKNDIDTLWRLLKDLPDAHVEGNAKLEEINLGNFDGGFYSPSTMEIELGAGILSHRESFEDTLRHEVGHAVHEANPGLIDGWLWQRFGWSMFPTNQAGIDDWIAQMGAATGYARLSAAQKAQVRSLVRQCCGEGEAWSGPAKPSAPAGSPWAAAGFGPRLAFEKTPEEWYSGSEHWYVAGDKAFAYNFWYAQPMCVNVATLDFVRRQMPDAYAAMSPAEFFAELYALYFDLDDPQRKNIPKDVAAWMKKNLGKADATQPLRPKSATSRTKVKRPTPPKPRRPST